MGQFDCIEEAVEKEINEGRKKMKSLVIRLKERKWKVRWKFDVTKLFFILIYLENNLIKNIILKNIN